MAAIASGLRPPLDIRVMARNETAILPTSRGSMPTAMSANRRIRSEVALVAPKSSLYSDQPTRPSSVDNLTKEKLRQPPSALRVSILVIRMVTWPWVASQRNDVGERIAAHDSLHIVFRNRGHKQRANSSAGAREMRRNDQVGCSPERVVFRQRFRVGHVEPGTRDDAGRQCLDQGEAVDDRPTCDIDQEGPALARIKRPRSEQAL